eukprot:s156_g23.t1
MDPTIKGNVQTIDHAFAVEVTGNQSRAGSPDLAKSKGKGKALQLAYYLAVVKGKGKGKTADTQRVEKEANEKVVPKEKKTKKTEEQHEEEPEEKTSKKTKKFDEEEREPGLDEAPKEKKLKKAKNMDEEEHLDDEVPKEKKPKKAKKLDEEEQEACFDEVPKEKKPKKAKKLDEEEPEPCLDAAPKEKKAKKAKKLEEEPEPCLALALVEEPPKEKNAKKERMIPDQEEPVQDDAMVKKKDKKLKKEKTKEDLEPALGDETPVEKKQKKKKKPCLESPAKTEEDSPDVITRQVVDLDDGPDDEEHEDSQLETPKRIALNMMRPEDWQRIKKREQANKDTSDDDTESEKKRRKVTWHDEPEVDSRRKKMTGTVGPEKLVRLNTSTSTDSLGTENYVTPDKPTTRRQHSPPAPQESEKKDKDVYEDLPLFVIEQTYGGRWAAGGESQGKGKAKGCSKAKRLEDANFQGKTIPEIQDMKKQKQKKIEACIEDIENAQSTVKSWKSRAKRVAANKEKAKAKAKAKSAKKDEDESEESSSELEEHEGHDEDEWDPEEQGQWYDDCADSWWDDWRLDLAQTAINDLVDEFFEKLAKGGVPWPFKAQLNEDLIARGKPEHVRQSVTLPHDIVHSMFKFPGIFHHIWTGAPGELEKYWAYNLDLADELGIQEQETFSP